MVQSLLFKDSNFYNSIVSKAVLIASSLTSLKQILKYLHALK